MFNAKNNVTDIFNGKIAYLQQLRCVLEIMHWADAYLTTYVIFPLNCSRQIHSYATFQPIRTKELLPIINVLHTRALSLMSTHARASMTSRWGQYRASVVIVTNPAIL